jgi:hypothetical protein
LIIDNDDKIHSLNKFILFFYIRMIWEANQNYLDFKKVSLFYVDNASRYLCRYRDKV